MFKFSCPHCEQHLEADQPCIGAEIECPGCDRRFTVQHGKLASSEPASTAATPLPSEKWKWGSRKAVGVMTIASLLVLTGIAAVFLIAHHGSKTEARPKIAPVTTPPDEFVEIPKQYQRMPGVRPKAFASNGANGFDTDAFLKGMTVTEKSTPVISPDNPFAEIPLPKAETPEQPAKIKPDIPTKPKSPTIDELATPQPRKPPSELLDLVSIAKKARSAVVLIVTLDADKKEIATGSGFFLNDTGLLLTNFHVIEGASGAFAKAENGAALPIVGIWGFDTENDLALLAVPTKNVSFLPLGNSSTAEPGTRIAVIGSPLGLEGSLSEGIISAKRELKKGVTLLQITAPISHGSSGSPVLDATGNVLGIAEGMLTEGQALNLAIPSEAARNLWEHSRRNRRLISFSDFSAAGIKPKIAPNEHLAPQRPPIAQNPPPNNRRPVTLSYVGHAGFIGEVSSNGAIITLGDDSMWQVAPSDQLDTELWLPPSDIRIIAGDDAEYPYKMVNKEEGQIARVKLLSR